MMAALIYFFLVLTPLMAEEPVSLEAQFLRRGDLPDEFRFPLLELDFVVLRVKAKNVEQQSWTLRTQEIVLRDPKGKILTRVEPFEITPKIMNSKAFRRYNRAVHGQVGYGYPGTVHGPRTVHGPPYRVDPVPRIPSGPKVISVDTAKRIRSVLEKHEVKETRLAPGETSEGFLYFKSKKPAQKLSGSTLTLSDKQVRIP